MTIPEQVRDHNMKIAQLKEVYAMLHDADVMLHDALLVLSEADTMHRQGIEARATAYKLRSDVLGVGWYASDKGDKDAWFS